MKNYEIWIGKTNFGQGFVQSTCPKKLALVMAPSFRIACLIYELRNKLESINVKIENNEYINDQMCRWFYDYDSNSNFWTGEYFESKEEAENSFNKKKE